VRARDTADYQQREYDRERRLIASGISSQAEVDRAAHALDDARTRVEAAAQQVSAAAAALGGNPNIAPDRHPAVQQAQARLDRARLDLSYTVVRAPADGVVSHVEQLQVGNHIAASAPAFALVVVGDLWIEANFKEDQLTHMHAGQVATVEVDSYPGRRFEARVASVSPGTGSQFSALPPENATGNWVKVVQRLPVRVELFHPDPAYPLYAGLSATVSVDTKHERHLFASAQADGRVPH
jgi:membrane fusion protein (multidrug efflux system)